MAELSDYERIMQELADERRRRKMAEEVNKQAEKDKMIAEEGRMKAEEDKMIAEEGRMKAEEVIIKAEKDKLIAEEGRMKAEEEKMIAEEGRMKAEEDKMIAEERGKKLDKISRKTTLVEYLSFCHDYLSKSLSVQTDKSQTTKGDPSNAKGKLRPDDLCLWEEFLETQKETLELLYSKYPADDMPRVFESFDFIETLGARVASRKLGSEGDLQYIQREIVETSVTRIIQHLQSLDDICEEFGLAGGIVFENHLNSLSDGAEEVTERLEQQRLQPSTPRHSTILKHRPRPDQICVYTTTKGLRKPALTIEYKAPHKLTLAMLRHVLQRGEHRIELQSVINRAEVPPSESTEACFEYHAERLVTAVITQAFSYMVRSGTQYGYVTTGEAFVFLHIKMEDEMKTAYYHFAEPNEDVKAQKEDFPNAEDYLHRTAISQVVAFSILAIKSARNNLEWRECMIKKLAIWEQDDKAILEAIPETVHKSPPMLDYYSQSYILDVRSPGETPIRSPCQTPIRSPIRNRLRPRKTIANTCRPGSNNTTKDDQDPPSPPDEEDPPPLDSPTRGQDRVRGKPNQRTRPTGGSNTSSGGSQSRAFCTQACLQGLVRGGPIDHRCPNVASHCKKEYQGDGHQLDGEKFLILLNEQLQQRRGDACQPLGMQGARGALFKVMLTSYGYTVAAKGTVLAFVVDLRHEAEVYKQLTKIQGIRVPMYLGSIDLNRPFYYDAGICIVHLMLLSWSGESLDDSEKFKSTEGKMWTSDVVRAVQAIHGAGVVHRDVRLPNLLWNEEMNRVMVIDFERSVIVKAVRRALMPMSPNRKRKRILGAKEADEEINIMDMVKGNPRLELQVGLDLHAAKTMFT